MLPESIWLKELMTTVYVRVTCVYMHAHSHTQLAIDHLQAKVGVGQGLHPSLLLALYLAQKSVIHRALTHQVWDL